MSSVGLSGRGWRWRIITGGTEGVRKGADCEMGRFRGGPRSGMRDALPVVMG